MCNNTLGNLIIWGILSIFGAIFWGGCPFEIKYMFFIMN